MITLHPILPQVQKQLFNTWHLVFFLPNVHVWKQTVDFFHPFCMNRQTNRHPVISVTVKRTNDGGLLWNTQLANMSADNHSWPCTVCSFNPEPVMAQKSWCYGFGSVRGTGVRWVCLPLLLQCYDRPNEIYGELGLSFCSITHPLSCTRNPLWNCPQTHPLGWMDASADVPDNGAFSGFFMVYIYCKHSRGLWWWHFCYSHMLQTKRNACFQKSVFTIVHKEYRLFCFSPIHVCNKSRPQTFSFFFKSHQSRDEIIQISHLRKATMYPLPLS